VRGVGIMQGRLLPPIKGHIQAFPEKRWRGKYQNLYRSGATKKYIVCFSSNNNLYITYNNLEARKSLEEQYYTLQVCH
jgi:hypothetical protein